MNLYFRLILILISALRAPRSNAPLDTFTTRFRVLPNDLDLNGHMNNGRYLTIMDLGRLDYITRIGLLQIMWREKKMPVLAAAQVRFRLPLMPFQQYDLQTRIVCWDEKWVYIEQRFIIASGNKAGAIAAIGLLKGGFYDGKKRQTVPTSEVMALAGVNTASPAMPGYIEKWSAAEDSLREQTQG